MRSQERRMELMIVEDDWVAARWQIHATHQGSGKAIIDYTGQNIWHVRNGKLVEVRNNRDDLLIFQQLGLIPSRAELWKQAGLVSSPYVSGAAG